MPMIYLVGDGHIKSHKNGMARPKRLELLTPRFVVWCSIQLSYGRNDIWIYAGGCGASKIQNSPHHSQSPVLNQVQLKSLFWDILKNRFQGAGTLANADMRRRGQFDSFLFLVQLIGSKALAPRRMPTCVGGVSSIRFYFCYN